MTPQDVKAMLNTGCDGVMIGRGAVSNPWLFQQAHHFLATQELLPAPDIRERIRVCLEHLTLTCQVKTCRKPVVAFRKHYAGYLKGLPNLSALRTDLMRLEELDDVAARLNLYLAEDGSHA